MFVPHVVDFERLSNKIERNGILQEVTTCINLSMVSRMLQGKSTFLSLLYNMFNTESFKGKQHG